MPFTLVLLATGLTLADSPAHSIGLHGQQACPLRFAHDADAEGMEAFCKSACAEGEETTTATEEVGSYRVEVGLGLRSGFSDIDDPGLVDGMRLTGRVPLRIPGLVVEGSFYVRTSRETVTGSAEYTVLQAQVHGVAHFQQPVSSDLWSAAALIDWGFGERDEETLPHTGPRLLVGVELARTETYYAQHWGYSFAVQAVEGADLLATSDPAKIWRIPIMVAGIAFDLFPSRRFGLRACWLARATWEEEPDYDPENHNALGRQVTNRGVFALDLLARF